MTWEDNLSYHRSVSSEGYVITWADNGHGRWHNAWAKRQDGQRRGKHLGSGYQRRELEEICERHYRDRFARESLTIGALAL
jgi:hypothetical protein